MLTTLSGILSGQGRRETEYVLKEEKVKGVSCERQTDTSLLKCSWEEPAERVNLNL